MQLKKKESDSKVKKKNHGKTKSKETIFRVLQSFCFLNVIITVMVVVTGLFLVMVHLLNLVGHCFVGNILMKLYIM